MKKYILSILVSFLFISQIYAVPNNSMSVAPSAVDQTTITASDENTRNAEISSKFNAHGHTDISQTANVLSVGDGLGSANKEIRANNADANKPSIEFWNDYDRWVVSADGGVTGVSIHENAVYIHGSAAKLFIGQSDGGCSSCGVDAAGTTWSCVDTGCP